MGAVTQHFERDAEKEITVSISQLPDCKTSLDTGQVRIIAIQPYNRGKGVPEDKAEGVRWYLKAAEQGNAMAQCNLGQCYFNGDGVDKDRTEALKWYRKAAEQGDAEAQRMARVIASGLDLPAITQERL